jgi:hypothetical protein
VARQPKNPSSDREYADARASGVNQPAITDEQREQRLNASFLGVFNSAAGKEVLDYLKISFVQSVLGPTSSDAELRYREGQRSVIGIIEARILKGSKDARG